MNYVDRPAFAEGQLLAADDLELTVDYTRAALEAHDRSAHVPGVIDGMQLDLHANVAPLVGKAAFVTAGFALDRQGRRLSIATPLTIVTDPLAGEPTNPYPAFVWYSEASMTPVAALDPCGTVVNRVRENVNAGVFTSVAAALAAHPDAVCLGNLQWKSDLQAFDDYTGSDDPRQRGGVRASVVVAPEHRVLVEGEDDAATTLTLKGTLKAVAAADGTKPAIEVAGGALELCAHDGAPAAQTVSLSYDVANVTGNALVVGLGNDDAGSEFVVRSGSGTPLLTLDGAGEVTAQAASFGNLGASASVVVGSGADVLVIANVPPDNRVGLKASGKLPLAFGAGATDSASFVSGANPVATVDPNVVTHLKNNVALGTFDPGANLSGLAALTDVLTLCAVQREIVVKPGNTNLLEFTADGKVLNLAAGACDVTPETFKAADGSCLVRLGHFCVQFGTIASLSLHPITETPAAIVFPRAFALIPAFFVSAFISGKMTVGACATSVSTTGAGYKLVRFAPANPADGDGAQWSDTKANGARVSWLAAGVLVP